MSNSIERTLAEIPLPNRTNIAEAVRTRWDSLTKPRGSLGLLEDVVSKLAEIQSDAMPRTARRCIFTFCGDHGITAEGVSLYPSVVTREMVKNFVRGGAAINVLCRHLGIETCIVDAGVSGPKLIGALDRRIGSGTANFLRGPAMSRSQAQLCMEAGIAIAQEAATRFDLVGLGEMGIGNSSSASALLCAFTGAAPAEATGRGAGLDDAGVQHKCRVIAAALAAHQIDPQDPLSVISAFAGFEIAMMAGFLLGAAACRLPVVLDGFICGAAFLIARAFYSGIESHVFFAHQSAEHGHARLLASVNAKPLLHLEMRLGEGTAAALAIGLISSAADLHREMATFAEAGVSDANGKETIE